MSLSVTILKLDGVVFPGDTFRCAIEFKNTRPASSEDSPHHIETLAWASAQIYGQYIVDPGLIKLPTSTIQRSLAGSTLPKLENGRIMYSSNAEILVCEMKLKPQESRSLLFSCTLPSDSLPPSYSGTSIKYSHVFSLVLQKTASSLSGPPTILSLPFRLLNPTSGLRRNEFQLGCPSFKYTIQTKAFQPLDPLSSMELQSHHSTKAVKDKDTRKVLKSVFERFGKPVCIKVNKGTEHLAEFTVEKTIYELGDVVRGYIDFSNATVSAFFISMKLEVIEEVSNEYFASFPGKPSSISTKTLAESDEVLHNTQATNFEFHLPLNAPPTFASELVSVRWVLKFELVASSAPKSSESQPIDLTTLPDDKVERMTWTVPLKILVASYPFDLIEQQSKARKTWIL